MGLLAIRKEIKDQFDAYIHRRLMLRCFLLQAFEQLSTSLCHFYGKPLLKLSKV
jgi:hypothetical protein